MCGIIQFSLTDPIDLTRSKNYWFSVRTLNFIFIPQVVLLKTSHSPVQPCTLTLVSHCWVKGLSPIGTFAFWEVVIIVDNILLELRFLLTFPFLKCAEI